MDKIKLCVPEDVINEINMGNQKIKIHVAGNQCTFTYDPSLDSEKFAEYLDKYINKILKNNPDFIILNTNYGDELHIANVTFTIDPIIHLNRLFETIKG